MALILEEEDESTDSNSDCEPPTMYHYYKHAHELQVPAKFPRYNWLLLKKCESLEVALEFLQAEDTWDEDHSYDWEEDKMYYKCIQSNCPAKRYLLTEYETTHVVLFRTETEHYHRNCAPKELDQDLLKEIKKLVDIDIVEPSAIISALSDLEHLVPPTEEELGEYISHIKKNQFKRQHLEPEDLRMFILNYSSLPDNWHEPFVVDYEMSPAGFPLFFRMVLSTKHLLSCAGSVTIIHASATYRLSWQGYPVIVVGTSDKDKRFHPFCLFVTSNEYETKEDYRLIFAGLRQKILFFFRQRFKPKYLVNDASDSIQRAFQETFITVRMRICWGYARDEIKHRARSEMDESTQKEMFADLEMIHTITGKAAFNAAIYFFKQKYHEYTDFIDYLNDEWIMKNRNWYLGAVPGTPSTNATLNQYIRELRAKNIVNDDLNLVNFLLTISKIVNGWSTRYRRDPNWVFSLQPTIDIPLWANSFCWSRHPKELDMIRRNDRYLCYLVPVGDRSIIRRFNSPATNLKDFKKQYMSNWRVLVPVNKQEWARGKCNCPKFFKNFICPHVVGLAIRLKSVTVPPAAVALAKEERIDRLKAYLLKKRNADDDSD
ncbi:unnamed protein product [Chrysodeixis includens]|uniref:SWIM-type domain-containing protein n=1 Tax=Chrysodeixis includens TaxID=689277 RepID=A0A9P0BYY5_CHRIL|nr:unnamed protein product [Chrysodeixis includens]